MGTIITSNTELISDYLPKNNDVPIIIKFISEKPVDDVFLIECNGINYKFTFITYKDYFIYANDIAIKACPRVSSGNTYGTIVCIFALYKNVYYSLLVKDKFKNYLTNPGGNSECDESKLGCAMREVYEECGLKIDKNNLKKLAVIESRQYAFDTFFNNFTSAFYTIVEIESADVFAKITNYNNEEIEKIYLIESDTLLNGTDNKIDISIDHLNLIRYQYIKIKKPSFFHKITFI